jgi:hypothetical protein
MYLEWPNRFWAVSLDLILFLDFLKLFVKVHLAIRYQRAFLKIPYSYCPPFWADKVNSCWLAPAHAHCAHTSPKNFKHP